MTKTRFRFRFPDSRGVVVVVAVVVVVVVVVIVVVVEPHSDCVIVMLVNKMQWTGLLACAFIISLACNARMAIADPIGDACEDISGTWKSEVVRMERGVADQASFMSSGPISLSITVPDDANECFYLVKLEFEDPKTSSDTSFVLGGLKQDSVVPLTGVSGETDASYVFDKIPLASLNSNDDGTLSLQFLGRDGEEEMGYLAILSVLSRDGNDAADGAYGTWYIHFPLFPVSTCSSHITFRCCCGEAVSVYGRSMADHHIRASLIHPDSVWPVSCTELEGTYKRYACNTNAYGMYLST